MDPLPQPLVLSLPLPEVDTFELYRRIALPNRPSFLLESGRETEQTGRYSFMGTDPYQVFSGKEGAYEIRTRTETSVNEGNSFDALASLLRGSRMPTPEGLPPFVGGAVGYFGYDTVRTFERIPDIAVDDLGLPDFQFMFIDLFAALDHLTRSLHLIFAPPLDRMVDEPREKLYREGCERLAEFEARLSIPSGPLMTREAEIGITARPEQTRSEYMKKVLECQAYISSGDIYQANLSHRFALNVGVTFDGGNQVGTRALAQVLYARLRNINPSPFAALLEGEHLCLVSSSPERLVRLRNRYVETRPIAGTRPRGHVLSQDRQLTEELLANPKERAEHIMLVDLERNDLGRVCRFATIHVDEFMAVERYSHVSHIVSNVKGTLREDCDGFDLIRAVFPGGTITGVPKIRCMDIIERLEPVRRGPYTGSLGYISWNGDLDFNIIIRTLVLAGNRGYLQAGAGIVADSDPAREYDETLYKAEALIQALRKN